MPADTGHPRASRRVPRSWSPRTEVCAGGVQGPAQGVRRRTAARSHWRPHVCEEIALSVEHARPPTQRRGALHRLWYGLLLIQFVAVLVPSIYARQTPEVWGVPFFYWYQFLWILVSA